MKLISTTDYVLEFYTKCRKWNPIDSEETMNDLEKIWNYANFLKTPLELDMFINREEELFFENIKIDNEDGLIYPNVDFAPIIYNNPEPENIWILSGEFKTIEDLVPFNLILTQNTIKKYGI